MIRWNRKGWIIGLTECTCDGREPTRPIQRACFPVLIHKRGRGIDPLRVPVQPGRMTTQLPGRGRSISSWLDLTKKRIIGSVPIPPDGTTGCRCSICGLMCSPRRAGARRSRFNRQPSSDHCHGERSWLDACLRSTAIGQAEDPTHRRRRFEYTIETRFHLDMPSMQCNQR